jgi:hypothetical protein
MADFEETDDIKEDVIELQVVPYGHTLGHRVGRPLFLTARRFVGICKLIESGLSTTEACRRALVSYAGFRGHVARKPSYQKRIRKAEAIRDQVWRSDAIDAVRSAFGKNWASAMTFLERRYPNEFALRVVNRPDVNTQETGTPTRVIGLPAAEIEKLTGPEYTQRQDGSVERVVGGIKVVYARLTA